MALSVIYDHAQPRLAHDRISALAGGLELNGPYFQNTYIEPIRNRLMLMPGPLFADWYTTNTGIFEKIGPEDLTATTPDNWYTVADYKMADVAAGPWIASKGSAPGGLVTNTVWTKNRGMYLSIFAYGAGDNFVLAEFGWNPTPSYLESIGFRLHSGGDLEIWKNGSRVGNYNISGAIVGDQKTNVTIDLLLIPCSRREILIISRQGNGVSHVFEDISEDDAAPLITPESQFFVNFPTAKAQVQIAPISYPSNGYATSLDYQLGTAPEASDTLETYTNPAFAGGANKGWLIFGDPPYAGSIPANTTATLVKPDNSGAFVKNGVNKDCRIKVYMEGDGNYTPFINAAMVAFASINEDTDDSEETPVDEFLEQLAIDVPADPSGVTFRTQLLRPEEIEGSIVASLKRINNRPAKIVRDATVWIDGQGESPSWEMSTSDATQRLVLEFRDRWKSLETYMFKERMPLDGMNLVDALKFILKRVGLTDSDFDIEAVAFVLPAIPGAEAGEFNNIIEVGDTAAEWLQRLVETYAATFHYGFKPTATGVKFIFKSEATLSSLPFVYELWPSIQEAIDAGKSREEAFKFVYRTYEEETLGPAANDIRITGWDPRLQRVIQTHYPDVNSQDPTLAPSVRPENWMGEPLLFGMMDPGINSQAVCDRVAEQAHDALTPIQVLGEISCEAMVLDTNVPVWRGDDIWLHGKGRFRVISLGIDCDKEPDGDDEWQWRPGTYCLERKVAA